VLVAIVVALHLTLGPYPEHVSVMNVITKHGDPKPLGGRAIYCLQPAITTSL